MSWFPLEKLLSLLLLTFMIVASPSISIADWINLTGAENTRNIAEISIEKGQVKIKLEIFVQDIFIFEELVPDSVFSEPIAGRIGEEERIKIFANETLQIITNTGDKLSARLDRVEPRIRIERPSPLVGSINPYTRQRIPGPPEDKRVLYAELTYPFEKEPESLTIIPPTGENGYLKAPIGFICYHEGVPVVDFRSLTAKNTLLLNWDDPWYSSFTNKQLKRALQSGVRTYLYIEPYEVRHEILVRVKDMMTWIDFNLQGDEFIEEDEFNPVRQNIANFFMAREKVLIDGKQLKPILDRTAYVESSMLRSRFIEIPERVPLNTAMLGIVITYLTKGMPQEVVTEWDLFSERVQKVTARMIDPAGPFPYDLDPTDNVLKWTNYLKNYSIPTVDKIEVAEEHHGVTVPLLSLACAILLLPFGFIAVKSYKASRSIKAHVATIIILLISMVVLFPFYQISIGNNARASQMSEEDSRSIVESILKNVYRAFDFREEEDVYDKLAISVSGDLLEEIYLQNRQSMLIEQAGGAQAKVKQVEVLTTEVRDSKRQKGALDVRTKWSAVGSVGHWGHIHSRRNMYDAILTLAVVNGFWKITGIELLEEKRVDPYAQQ